MKIHSLHGYLSQCLTAVCKPSLFPCSAISCLPAAGHHWLLSWYLCPKLHLYDSRLGCEKTAVRCTLCLLFSKSFLLYHLLQAQEHFEQSYPQGQPGGCLALVAAIVQFCCPLRCPGPSLQSHHFINGCPCLSCLKTFTNRPAKVVSALFLEGPYGCL